MPDRSITVTRRNPDGTTTTVLSAAGDAAAELLRELEGAGPGIVLPPGHAIAIVGFAGYDDAPAAVAPQLFHVEPMTDLPPGFWSNTCDTPDHREQAALTATTLRSLLDGAKGDA